MYKVAAKSTNPHAATKSSHQQLEAAKAHDRILVRLRQVATGLVYHAMENEDFKYAVKLVFGRSDIIFTDILTDILNEVTRIVKDACDSKVPNANMEKDIENTIKQTFNQKIKVIHEQAMIKDEMMRVEAEVKQKTDEATKKILIEQEARINAIATRTYQRIYRGIFENREYA